MSKPDLDSEGFQTVITKRSSKNKQTKVPRNFSNITRQDTLLDIDKVVERIQSAIEDLRVSSYLEDVYKSVSTHVKSRKVAEIVCFGLGHVGECNISWYQTALLCCLKEHFKPTKTLVHDPIFTKSECDVLRNLGFGIIEENNEGTYIISNQDITLAYFPHCPKQLTNNFLWSNWSSNLQNCLLLCNSFTSLIDNNPSRIITESVPYIYKIFPHTFESKVNNTFRFTDIFNDTSIHSFPLKHLEKLPLNFWAKSEKPKYEDTEEFISSLMIEKLNL